MENPIKLFIQRKSEEQEKMAKIKAQGNNQKGTVFTDEDQRKILHMDSVQSKFNFNATDEDIYTLPSLYDMMKTGAVNEKLVPGLFPEILEREDKIYLPSNRYVRLDALRTQFEWYVIISKTKKDQYMINTDYRGSYVELYPIGWILHLTASTLHSSFVSLTNVYDLSSTKYRRVAVVDGINEKIKSIANDLDNEMRWNAKPPEADKVFYVPKGVERDDPMLWNVIDNFMIDIKSGERMKLSTTLIGGSNANTSMY